MNSIFAVPAGRLAKWLVALGWLVVVVAIIGGNLPGTFADAEKNESTSIIPGDAESTKIYAAAYGRDDEFFDFWRSMQALTRALAGNTTALVGSHECAFFRYFNGASAPEGDGALKPTSAQEAADRAAPAQ